MALGHAKCGRAKSLFLPHNAGSTSESLYGVPEKLDDNVAVLCSLCSAYNMSFSHPING